MPCKSLNYYHHHHNTVQPEFATEICLTAASNTLHQHKPHNATFFIVNPVYSFNMVAIMTTKTATTSTSKLPKNHDNDMLYVTFS